MGSLSRVLAIAAVLLCLPGCPETTTVTDDTGTTGMDGGPGSDTGPRPDAPGADAVVVREDAPGQDAPVVGEDAPVVGEDAPIIPADAFGAVAEILAHVYRASGREPAAA